MLSWIILILVLALVSILGVRLFASIFGRGEALPPMPPTEEVKEANRRAVEEGNFGDIQLEVVQRGYRMDQVDALIAQFAGETLGTFEKTTGKTTEETAPVPVAAEQVESVGTVEPAHVERTEGAMTHGSDEAANR